MVATKKVSSTKLKKASGGRSVGPQKKEREKDLASRLVTKKSLKRVTGAEGKIKRKEEKNKEQKVVGASLKRIAGGRLIVRKRKPTKSAGLKEGSPKKKELELL